MKRHLVLHVLVWVLVTTGCGTTEPESPPSLEDRPVKKVMVRHRNGSLSTNEVSHDGLAIAVNSVLRDSQLTPHVKLSTIRAVLYAAHVAGHLPPASIEPGELFLAEDTHTSEVTVVKFVAGVGPNRWDGVWLCEILLD